MQIPFNLGVLRLGGYLLQSLSTFYNGVKKILNFEIEKLLSYFWHVCECFYLKQKNGIFLNKV